VSLQATAFLAGVHGAARGGDGIPRWSRLREGGYQAGRAVVPAFATWLAARGEPAPEALPEAQLAPLLSGFLEELGWGHLTMAPWGSMLLRVEVYGWAEPTGAEGMAVTTGLLSGVLGAVADAPLAVLEIPPPPPLAPGRGTFLVGAGRVLERLHQGLAKGASVEGAMAQLLEERAPGNAAPDRLSRSGVPLAG
jgi:hypothetical protein